VEWPDWENQSGQALRDQWAPGPEQNPLLELEPELERVRPERKALR